MSEVSERSDRVHVPQQNWWRSLRLATLALMVIAATGVEAHAESQGDVTIALPSISQKFDPTGQVGATPHMTFDLLFDGLINLGQEGKYPGLAESWEISEDGLTIDFKLRRNVKFHDGTPFTAEDVKFTFERILEPDSGHAYRTGFEKSLDHVGVIDPHTARFVLKQPWPSFFTTARYGLTPIAPKAYYEKVGATGFQQRPIGTGPFSLDDMTAGEWTRYVANEDYWGGAPNIKTVTQLLVKEAFTRYAMLERGEVDIVAGLTGPLLQKIEASDDIEVLSARYVGTSGILFNKDLFPEAENRQVRLAIGHAINRKEIAEKIQGGVCEPATSMFTPATFGFLDGLPQIPYDPEKAKALLKEAGVEPGRKVTFTIQTTSFPAMPNAPQVLEVVAGNLEAAGFDVQRHNVDTSAWLDMMRGGKPTAIFYSPISLPDDGGEVMNSYFVSWSGWTAQSIQRPEYDEIFNAQIKTSDREERLKLLQKFAKMESENLENIPLLWCDAAFAINTKRIKKWRPALGSGYHTDMHLLELH